MKLFTRKRKPLAGITLDPVHEPTHKNGQAWSAPVGKVLLLEPDPEPITEAVIVNPKPYRGAVAKGVQRKMIRENVDNYIELSLMGAKEQAWSQLWSNFTKTCYAVGVPVDTNADLRMS